MALSGIWAAHISTYRMLSKMVLLFALYVLKMLRKMMPFGTVKGATAASMFHVFRSGLKTASITRLKLKQSPTLTLTDQNLIGFVLSVELSTHREVFQLSIYVSVVKNLILSLIHGLYLILVGITVEKD